MSDNTKVSRSMKRCPKCGQLIRRTALVCRHCGGNALVKRVKGEK